MTSRFLCLWLWYLIASENVQILLEIVDDLSALQNTLPDFLNRNRASA
jgi:hypothetical protein